MALAWLTNRNLHFNLWGISHFLIRHITAITCESSSYRRHSEALDDEKHPAAISVVTIFGNLKTPEEQEETSVYAVRSPTPVRFWHLSEIKHQIRVVT